MELHAHAFWLAHIDALTTVGNLGCMRWVIEAMELESYITIEFPYCDTATITLTDEGREVIEGERVRIAALRKPPTPTGESP